MIPKPRRVLRLTAAFVLTPASVSHAMDPETASLVPGCAFPSTVRIANHCTGSYLGDGVVLTAAHCTDGENPGFVTFGDADDVADPNGDRFTVAIEPHPSPVYNNQHACYAHPDGESKSLGGGVWHYAGVDLAVCVLDSTDPNYIRLASLPTVPLMVPTGCIRDWVREKLWITHNCPFGKVKSPGGCWVPPPPASMPADGTFPGLDLIAVGMGTEPDDDDGGFKRAFHPTFYVQVDNSGTNAPYADAVHPGSPTQLVATHVVDWLGNPNAGEAAMEGDSGGPILYRLPDLTWRVVGDLNGEASGASASNHEIYEAAPAYMHWIENVTGHDVSPCHDLNSEDEWEWHGNCMGQLPQSIHEVGGGTYQNNSCSQHSIGGLICGGWNASPLDKSTNSLPMPSHPWIQLAVIEDKYTSTLNLANQGYFGDPVDVDAVADYFYDEGREHSSYSYLANIHDEGELGGYLSITTSARFAGASGGEYEVFTEPDYACGKGRIVIVDPIGTRMHWNLDTNGVIGTAMCEDYFGAGLTVGDFNGDGYDDLAVGIPGATVSAVSAAGRIHILYGSSQGLTAVGDQAFDLDITGLGGVTEPWTYFGEQLTTGDFDCNGYDDLVVGTPRATIDGAHEAGSVHVLYGTGGGLSSVDEHYYEGRAGVGDSAEAHDHFGQSVGAGQLSGDNCSDLVIGVPGEDTSAGADVGQVHVFYGGLLGLPSEVDESLSQGQGDVADTGSPNDRFGARVEVIPLAGGDTLRIMVPNEQCNSVSDDPAFGWHIVPTGSSGLDLANDSLQCSPVGEYALPTDDWGDLEQLARLQAIHIAREANP